MALAVRAAVREVRRDWVVLLERTDRGITSGQYVYLDSHRRRDAVQRAVGLMSARGERGWHLAWVRRARRA